MPAMQMVMGPFEKTVKWKGEALILRQRPSQLLNTHAHRVNKTLSAGSGTLETSQTSKLL